MKVWNSTGRKPKKLEEPYFPGIVAHVWDWFCELNKARPSAGFGVSAITYPDIFAWAQLSCNVPTPWEVSLIKKLDSLFLKVNSKKAE